MSVKNFDYTPQLLAKQRRGFSLGLHMMGAETFRLADPRTPRKFGPLRRNKTLQVLGLRAILSWNVKYAARQEDVQYRRYTTAGTGPHFAENAVHEAMKRSGRIFKQAQRAL